MTFNFKKPANIFLLIGIFILFVILLRVRLQNMFIPQTSGRVVKNVKTEKTTASNDLINYATPTEAERHYADKDINYTSTSSYPPLFSVIIPKGATYYQAGEPLYIEGDNGLKVLVCTTCQLFIQGCNGLSDGDPKEGGCAIKDIPFKNGYTLESHYQPSEPDKILGYRINTTANENIYAKALNDIRITTDNNRVLTEKDKNFIYKIASSIIEK